VLGGRFRPDEERQIAEVVRESGKAQAKWIRDALLSAARRGVRDGRAWRLGSLFFFWPTVPTVPTGRGEIALRVRFGFPSS